MPQRHGPKRGLKRVPSPPPDSRSCVSASETRRPGTAYKQKPTPFDSFPSEITVRMKTRRVPTFELRFIHTKVTFKQMAKYLFAHKYRV